MNTLTLIGRTTADINLKKTESGIHLAEFSIAEQSDKNTVNYFDCIAWRTTAEHLEKYVRKGSMIAVAGKINIKKYKNKQGYMQKLFQVEVDKVEFLHLIGQEAKVEAKVEDIAESLGVKPVEEKQPEQQTTGNVLPF